MLSKRFLMVGELSSAARIPLPSATRAFAVSASAAELIVGPTIACLLWEGIYKNEPWRGDASRQQRGGDDQRPRPFRRRRGAGRWLRHRSRRRHHADPLASRP